MSEQTLISRYIICRYNNTYNMYKLQMLVSNCSLSYPSYPRVPRAPSIRGLTGGQIVSGRINTARIIILQKGEIYNTRGQQAVSPLIFLKPS